MGASLSVAVRKSSRPRGAPTQCSALPTSEFTPASRQSQGKVSSEYVCGDFSLFLLRSHCAP